MDGVLAGFRLKHRQPQWNRSGRTAALCETRKPRAISVRGGIQHFRL